MFPISPILDSHTLLKLLYVCPSFLLPFKIFTGNYMYTCILLCLSRYLCMHAFIIYILDFFAGLTKSSQDSPISAGKCKSIAASATNTKTAGQCHTHITITLHINSFLYIYIYTNILFWGRIHNT